MGYDVMGWDVALLSQEGKKVGAWEDMEVGMGEGGKVEMRGVEVMAEGRKRERERARVGSDAV